MEGHVRASGREMKTRIALAWTGPRWRWDLLNLGIDAGGRDERVRAEIELHARVGGGAWYGGAGLLLFLDR